MNRDPEMPAGFRTADYDMRALQAVAARVDAAAKRGICAHGWSREDKATRQCTCLHCGKVFATFQAMMNERAEVIG